ncbi:twin arginine-targeting protein translocase TatB [Corynebacterium sp. BCW_4722]|nr:twin arginine-targeting protein translocase TatB [Corynebacterium sp. BCW_4722]
MFSNIGWGEIFTVLIVGLIIIGPERLPGVVEDVRAAIYAARKAINNAKAELNGELGEDFAEFKGSMDTVTQYAAMGPKRAVAKVLFDGDESYLDSFDPREMMQENTGPVKSGPRPSGSKPRPPAPPPAQPSQPKPKEGGSGFSWADIT